MFEFLKRLRKENSSGVSANLESTEQPNLISSEPIGTMEVEDKVEILKNEEFQAIDIPKFIIKEDAKIMSIPCDHKNILPQTLLKIDKKLITDPKDVSIYVNLSHLDNVDIIEDTQKYEIDIQDPCGGPNTIKGEALLEKVILIGGVHYSILMFDTTTKSKVYDGDIEFLTAYTLLEVVPFPTEVPTPNPNKVSANFTTVLTKLDDIPGVDYYLYTVDGEVELKLLP